jgi:amidase
MGKLHGIPVLVKDSIGTEPQLGRHEGLSWLQFIAYGNMSVGTGMRTTAGSYALLNSVPAEDATVTAKLRAAGAIILGKTTMCEFGHYRTSAVSNPCHGWSSRGGQGLSAYVAGGCPDANPGGSSSGSAIAVSAGWAPATLGTDTIGSLMAPAGRAAGYTIRSTVGLVSRYGVIPASRHLDTVGPITKSAHDTALLLECMSGYDPKDPASTFSVRVREETWKTETASCSSYCCSGSYTSRVYQVFKDALRNFHRETSRSSKNRCL